MNLLQNTFIIIPKHLPCCISWGFFYSLWNPKITIYEWILKGDIYCGYNTSFNAAHCMKHFSGLQISQSLDIGHWPNTIYSCLTKAQTLFWKEKKRKFSSVLYILGPLFHSLKVTYYTYIDFLKPLWFFMSNHIFVLSDQNSDLAGHMSFQNKKKIVAALLQDY